MARMTNSSLVLVVCRAGEKAMKMHIFITWTWETAIHYSQYLMGMEGSK
jgi:hypothetical protein